MIPSRSNPKHVKCLNTEFRLQLPFNKQIRYFMHSGQHQYLKSAIYCRLRSKVHDKIKMFNSLIQANRLTHIPHEKLMHILNIPI